MPPNDSLAPLVRKFPSPSNARLAHPSKSALPLQSCAEPTLRRLFRCSAVPLFRHSVWGPPAAVQRVPPLRQMKTCTSAGAPTLPLLYLFTKPTACFRATAQRGIAPWGAGASTKVRAHNASRAPVPSQSAHTKMWRSLFCVWGTNFSAEFGLRIVRETCLRLGGQHHYYTFTEQSFPISLSTLYSTKRHVSADKVATPATSKTLLDCTPCCGCVTREGLSTASPAPPQKRHRYLATNKPRGQHASTVSKQKPAQTPWHVRPDKRPESYSDVSCLGDTQVDGET
ncbi:hypothetical protein PMIN01_05271 [Paraphaeosphaeria minitans]|uniref:Uncharacterized protein n=1 Tax=Paraphaeosphaeria minitans TaxID=565426 RepID=A0A9P6GKM4_9PLEO|nr:hypothetical protein PMIN01_05271 [Paraphaeosphaeria minitans]